MACVRDDRRLQRVARAFGSHDVGIDLISEHAAGEKCLWNAEWQQFDG